MRNLAKLALVALVAVMCVDALAATSASAGEQLFITESGKALLFTTTSGAVTLRAKVAGVEGIITCEQSNGHGLVLNRSSLARELHIEFKGKCEQTIGGGSKEACTEPIKPGLAYGELGLLHGHVLLYVAPEKETEFVSAHCGSTTTKIGGAVIGEFPLTGTDGLQQYNILREKILLGYKAKGTTQEPEEIELLGSLMKGVTLKVEGLFGEKASEEGVQLLSSDGSVAIAEVPTRGFLVVLQTGELKIPENKVNTYTVEYHEMTGNSGTIKRFWGLEPIITGPGGTCGNVNNLTNAQTCTMEVGCALNTKGLRGIAGVLSTSAPGVIGANKDVECT